MFYQLPIVTLKAPLYLFRTELYRKARKDFEASGFPSCILNDTTFFEPVTEIKKISCYQEKWRRSGKKMVYAKVTFLL